jgi:DNA (cytosine-5)-methyltransferase 1
VATYAVKLQRSDDLQLASHADGCSEKTFQQWCSDRVNAGARLAVDLFSGAGGLSLGLEDAGWTIALAVDNDEKALQTHRHNFPGLTLARNLGDPEQRSGLLTLLDGIDVDLLAGGPPCQPFSRAGLSKIRSLVAAGHRNEDDPRRELWHAFLDIALAVRPRAVLMENVPDMALGDDFSVIRKMMDALENADYYTDLILVDAWRYGVPQHRKRLILLARLDAEHFPWPAQQSRLPTLREAISDLPCLGQTTGARALPYSSKPDLPAFAKKMRDGMQNGFVWDHITRPVRDDDREIFQMMDSSTLYGNLPPEKRRYSADTFDDKYKKLGWDSRSRSITAHIAKDGYWYIHPSELRTLTVREAARIQTFPDRFRFAGTRSDAFRQIGNAVPPLLGEAAASALEPVRPGTDAGRLREGVSRWVVSRLALTTWARLQRHERHWYMLPGPSLTVAVAAAATLLTARPALPPGAANALRAIRGRVRLSKVDLDQMGEELLTESGRAVVELFRPLLRKRNIWNDHALLADALHMKSSQERTFLLLTGHDVLLATQPTLRVAARVAGSESHLVNRMSNGRVDLARLVGVGDDAPLRAAALRLIGNTICLPARPECARCPLQENCVSSAQQSAPQTLF